MAETEQKAILEFIDFAGALLDDGIKHLTGEGDPDEDLASDYSEKERKRRKAKKKKAAKQKRERMRKLEQSKKMSKSAQIQQELEAFQKDGIPSREEIQHKEQLYRIQQRQEEDAELIRRHKQIDEAREQALRDALTKQEKDFEKIVDEDESLLLPKDQILLVDVNEKVFTKACLPPRPEDQSFRIGGEESPIDLVDDVEDEAQDEPEEDEVQINHELTMQLAHEMNQLIQYSHKSKQDAKRLLQYKRIAIDNAQEVPEELEAHLSKAMAHDKLTAALNRFISHKEHGEVPENNETIKMELALRGNILALQDLSHISDNMVPRESFAYHQNVDFE